MAHQCQPQQSAVPKDPPADWDSRTLGSLRRADCLADFAGIAICLGLSSQLASSCWHLFVGTVAYQWQQAAATYLLSAIYYLSSATPRKPTRPREGEIASSAASFSTACISTAWLAYTVQCYLEGPNIFEKHSRNAGLLCNMREFSPSFPVLHWP